MRLFNFDIHIGKWRVLVQTRDIADKAVTGRKIADRVIDWLHIMKKAIRNEHIDDDAVDTRTIAEDAVRTFHLHDKAVTPEKLSGRVVGEIIDPRIRNLQNQIDSFNEHGLSVANGFGDDPHIGISQKALTDAFNRLWNKLEDITGESFCGFSMIVSPSYYVGEEGCGIHITANTADTAGIFEKIEFYINGLKITEAEDVAYFEYDTEINETSVVRCVAKILGIEYEQQKIITHFSSFWLGAGTSYRDIMVNENLVSIGNNMRGAYDVAVNDGDRIIVVIGASLREGFIRADMNGAEILFDEYPVTVYGNEYVVFASRSTYIGGTYNIDING